MTGIARKENLREVSDPPMPGSSANTRVDAAHLAANGEQPSAAPLESLESAGIEVVSDGGSPAAERDPEPFAAATAIVQQVRAQAGQLAAHLRRQQTAIDHREAELNARLGAMDRELRAARLWLSEQQQALEAERAELDTRRKQLLARNAELSKRQEGANKLCGDLEQELRRREAELETREATLARRLDELAQSSVEARETLAAEAQRLAAREAALAARELEVDRGRGEIVRLQQEAQQRCDQLDVRARRLATEEALLTQEQDEQRQAREMTHAEQSAWQTEVSSERRRLVDDREKFDREILKKKNVLRQRRDDLDRRREAIKRLRGEVAAAQRETLEMRLATEELWARMSGSTPTAALTQSLAELRRKLAMQQSRAAAELATQRDELTALATRLGEEREKLTRQRGEMQDWLNHRSTELAEQTAALVAREEQLGAQNAAMQRAKFEHNEERRAYQREIRKLLGQLRELEARPTEG